MEEKAVQQKSKKRIILSNIGFVAYVLFMLITICISSFVWFQKNYFYHYWVDGQSMWPTLNQYAKTKNGEYMNEDYQSMVGATDVDFVIGDGSDIAINGIKRFDIIVCKTSSSSKKDLIKRVIAMPGETFYIDSTLVGDETNGVLHVYDEEAEEFKVVEQPIKTEYICRADYPVKYSEPTKLKDDEYFVMGDNRIHSTDSREVGFIHKKNIESKIIALIARCGVTLDSTGVDKIATNVKYMWPRYY